MKLGAQLNRDLFTRNPVLAQMLGLCSALAVSTSVRNGLGMGVIVLASLTAFNFVLSAVRKLIPDPIRPAVSLLTAACFASCADLLTRAFAPGLAEALGIYLPLTVVSCVLLSRANALAGKSGVLASTAGGVCQGLGYTAAVLAVSAVRELLGSGTLDGVRVLPERFSAGAMTLPVGGFLVLGCLAAGLQRIRSKSEKGKVNRP